MAGVNGVGMGLPSEESTGGVRIKMELPRSLKETHLGGVRCGIGRPGWYE